MKKARIFAFLSALSAVLTGCNSTEEGGGFSLWPVLLILLALAVAALAGLRVYSILQYNRRRTRGGRRRRPRKIDPMTWCMFALAAVLFIGCITFLCSAAGVKIGNVFGMRFKSKAELAGGVILILMGCKILLEHLGILVF